MMARLVPLQTGLRRLRGFAQYSFPCARVLLGHRGLPPRHLRFSAAVAEGLNVKAVTRLRIAQPVLSRQAHDLEDELGVDLQRCSPRCIFA
jgi:hypothetical protein